MLSVAQNHIIKDQKKLEDGVIVLFHVPEVSMCLIQVLSGPCTVTMFHYAKYVDI
jgi:hypothetical protein